MLDALHVVVPVTVHQVCDASACCLWQVVRVLPDNLMERHRLDDDDFLTVGRELKAFNLAVSLAELSAVGAVSIHGPYLSTGSKGNGLCVQPGGVGLVLAAGCQLALVGAVTIHHADDLVTLVLLDAVVANLIDYQTSVWRGLDSADASHGPKGFRGHHATCQFDVLFSNHFCFLCIKCSACRE